MVLYSTFLQKIISRTNIGRFLCGFSVVDFSAVFFVFNELKQIWYTHVLQNSANNKNVEKYNSLISENLTTTTGVQNKKGYKTNNKLKERRKKMAKKRIERQRKNNEKFIKNFSNQQLSDSQISVLSKGLKFVPTPVTDVNYIRRQLLLDFEHFARRMRLK